jgi:hypothetical protein
MTCVPCSNAEIRGWWGPDHKGTHCRDCHRSWTGTTQVHCVGCHEHFTSARAFDAHLTHCAPDARETLPVAVRNDGNPVFVLRDLNDGPAWSLWRADPHPFGGEAA